MIDPRRTYVLKGTTLQALVSGRVVAGPGLLERGVADGSRVFMVDPTVAGTSSKGMFARTFLSEGALFLTGGTVKGGTGTATVADFSINSVAAGHVVWLSCAWTGVAADGVLLPGGSVGAVTTGSGASAPTDTLPTAESTSGTAIIPLGVRTATGFTPAGSGGVLLYFPVYGFTTYRDTGA